MTMHGGRTTVLAIVIGVTVGVVAPGAWNAAAAQDEMPFSEGRLFFELNDTDGDLGIHGSIDGVPWKRLVIEDPDERTILNIRAKGRLRRQGMTQLFFESAEPSFDELEPAQFFHRFPEGEYEIEGTKLDGGELESTAVISHVLADRARNITLSGVAAAEDCDADPLPVIAAPVVIDWDPVTESHPEIGKEGDVEVEIYQVVVENDEVVLSVELTPDVTSLTIPEGFTDLDSGDGFKFEILVRHENGNQTAVESCFELQ